MISSNTYYDNIIIGAGLYGLYSAHRLAGLGHHVLVLEYDTAAFMRATYINQARVHMGYHYPRSLTTAIKSAGYFDRFVADFGFCIRQDFKQVYATSSEFSWTNAAQFMDFCKAAGIRCDEEPVSKYFNPGVCDGAFVTEEYTYDAKILGTYLLDVINKSGNVDIIYNSRIHHIDRMSDEYVINMVDGVVYRTEYVINATYAGVNQILSRTEGLENHLFPIKYELCEIILCDVSDELRGIGITVMDGPFFSIMPFGKTGMHSLTSVAFTPHITCKETLPHFECQKYIQKGESSCSSSMLGNCNECLYRPESAWPYMSHLAQKYMLPQYGFTYRQSLFSQKPIMKSSEIDDSRPTMIDYVADVDEIGSRTIGPRFLSVLSGKINTVYDMDEYLV